MDDSSEKFFILFARCRVAASRGLCFSFAENVGKESSGKAFRSTLSAKFSLLVASTVEQAAEYSLVRLVVLALNVNGTVDIVQFSTVNARVRLLVLGMRHVIDVDGPERVVEVFFELLVELFDSSCLLHLHLSHFLFEANVFEHLQNDVRCEGEHADKGKCEPRDRFAVEVEEKPVQVLLFGKERDGRKSERKSQSKKLMTTTCWPAQMDLVILTPETSLAK